MKLTQHFELNEFTRSATATAHGIDNSLNPTKAGDRIVIENLQHLCQTVLEPLREFVNAPVVVSSGYRCSELNKMVGGVRNSQHLTGEAADIQPMWHVETRHATSLQTQHDNETRHGITAVETRHATSLPSPIFQRDSTVPPPLGRESVDIRWTIGRGTKKDLQRISLPKKRHHRRDAACNYRRDAACHVSTFPSSRGESVSPLASLAAAVIGGRRTKKSSILEIVVISKT